MLNISYATGSTDTAGVWGFHADQVADAINAGATGAISGSAIVRIIEKNRDNEETMLAELKAFVMSMKAATHQR